MSQLAVKRPKGITIIAWLWIVVGGFWILLGATAIAKGVETLGTFMVLHVAPSAAAAWAGINLLRLKAWARIAIVIFSVLLAIKCINAGYVWIYAATIINRHVPSTGAPVDVSRVQFFTVALGILAISFAILLVIMIRYLYGTKIREVFANVRQAETSSNP